MTIGLVVSLFLGDRRRWIKAVGIVALLAVVAQGALGGARVLLFSSGEAVTVAVSMTIPEGETRAFFRFHASPVAATATVLITATSANSIRGTLTVTPAN